MNAERLMAVLASGYLVAACSPVGSVAPDVVAAATRWTPTAIAGPGYESTPTFAPDGRTMIYIAADATFATHRLALSRCVGGQWNAPESLSFAAINSGLDSDPFWTRDGAFLYFISTRHDPAHEDYDIYRVARDADGGWGSPERLPAPINSPASELLPRITADGRLYFGSSRAGGQGQGDIYVATAGPKGWTVTNVGPPVSTAAFEYEAEVSADGRSMVVVADRGDRSHLYRFEKDGAEWQERGRVPAFDTQFQVGPVLSPKGDRLIFAQRDGERSGEMFLLDLVRNPDRSWPPACR